MSTTFLALLILGCAIIVFFSQEFGKFYKKIMAKPGMKIVLPLTLVSLLLVLYEPWIMWAAFSLQAGFISLAYALASILPFPKIAIYISMFLILVFLCLVPSIAIDAWIKRTDYLGFKQQGVLCFFIWIVVAMVLITGIFSPYR